MRHSELGARIVDVGAMPLGGLLRARKQAGRPLIVAEWNELTDDRSEVVSRQRSMSSLLPVRGSRPTFLTE
jgi:hypothetical protein